MHGEQRRVVVRNHRNLACAGRGERFPDREGARGHFRRRRSHPDPDLRVRLVEEAVVAPDERQH